MSKKEYRCVSYLKQLWHGVKNAVKSWFEWKDAKSWAKEYHPAWLQIARKARLSDVRQCYRNKILEEYRIFYADPQPPKEAQE